MPFAVMLDCRAGTHQLVGDGWEDRYHTITWVVEESRADAERIARDQMLSNPREVRRAWVAEVYDPGRWF
jgi:hypothetical protein